MVVLRRFKVDHLKNLNHKLILLSLEKAGLNPNIYINLIFIISKELSNKILTNILKNLRICVSDVP